jgi:hypothetical protein
MTQYQAKEFTKLLPLKQKNNYLVYMRPESQPSIEKREASLSKALAEHLRVIKQHFPNQIFTSNMLSERESKPGANLGGPLKSLCQEGLLFSYLLTSKLVGRTTLTVYSLAPIDPESIPEELFSRIRGQTKQSTSSESFENKDALTPNEIAAIEKLFKGYTPDAEIGYEAIKAVLTRFKIFNTGIFFDKALNNGYLGYVAKRENFKNSSFKILKNYKITY